MSMKYLIALIVLPLFSLSIQYQGFATLDLAKQNACDTDQIQSLLDEAADAADSGDMDQADALRGDAYNIVQNCNITANADWTPVEHYLDGLRMVLVPPGCFWMGTSDVQADAMTSFASQAGLGFTAETFADQQPVHEVCFDEPFWIGYAEVSRIEYFECMAQGICEENVRIEFPIPDDGAVGGVEFEQALNYCGLFGARLPTEAEWEYVARGPDSWLFPWGNEFKRTEEEIVKLGTFLDGVVSVDSAADIASWVGAVHTTDNLSEWTSSIYADYPYVADDGRENLDDLDSPRVIRGGSYYQQIFADVYSLAPLRESLLPTFESYNVMGGTYDEFKPQTVTIRCARSIE